MAMRNKLILAYLLICIDFIATKAGIVRGICEEGNPLLVKVFEGNMWAVVMILIGVLLLLTYRQKDRIRPKILSTGYTAIIVTRIPIILLHVGGWLWS